MANSMVNGQRRPEYIAWVAMLARCLRPSHPGFRNYGGRGITVCARWRTFENFYADVGPRPSRRHSIERMNNDGHYEPGNVIWADKETQVNNMRKSRRVTFNGETLTVSQWCRRLGMPKTTLLWRLNSGMPPHLALTAPPVIAGRGGWRARKDIHG